MYENLNIAFKLQRNERDSTSLLCLIVERKINPSNFKINWNKNVPKIVI